MRLEFDEHREHSQQVADGELRLPQFQFRPQPLRQLLHGTAEDDREQGPQHVGKPVHQLAEVHAEVRQPSHRREHITSPVLGDQVDEGKVLVFVHEPEGLAHSLGRHVAVAERQHLIGEGEGIAHRSVGGAGQHAERVGLTADRLGREHHGQSLAHIVGADPPEVEALEAGEHRRRRLGNLLRLRRGEDEHHARRRLLENLQQRVPRLSGEHVRLVHDIDLVSVLTAGRVHRPLTQVSGVVHATIRGSVDLHHVERRRPGPNPGARFTRPAGLAVLAFLRAVEGHRQHAGERCLAGAARATEQVSVRHPTAGNRALERVRHVGLYRHVGESPRTVLSGEGNGHAPKLVFAPGNG